MTDLRDAARVQDARLREVVSVRPRTGSYKRKARFEAIAERDGWACQLCGEPVRRDARGAGAPTVDHIIRRVDGGPNTRKNLRLAHAACNEYRDGANVMPVAPLLAHIVREQAA